MNVNNLRSDAEEHLKLAQGTADVSDQDENWNEALITTPLFTLAASESLAANHENGDADKDKRTKKESSIQYGLLGMRIQGPGDTSEPNNLVYTNVSAPWSAFICGSQGSGKSHTFSCLLENMLMSPSPVGKLNSPLTGLAMHYDKFTTFSSTQLSEAAYLFTAGIPVRVLVSPTNYSTMKAAYEGISKGNRLFVVEPLYLPQRYLNTSMMKTLMGINNKAGQPLYMEVVLKILRQMAVMNQGQAGFNYAEFKRRLACEEFIRGQLGPLHMRLEVLESFFEPGSVPNVKSNGPRVATRSTWSFPPGSLTIIDLSCPFVDPEDACVLFNISASLFLKDRRETGRVIAMDEAHKFLNSTSPEALELTETLLSIIRQQRHLATRVLIATQEPTLAPALLELCNMTIIHRFSSPAWYRAIKAHIAGADNNNNQDVQSGKIFDKIVRLATGEGLLFCPTALLDVGRMAESEIGGRYSNELFEAFSTSEYGTTSRKGGYFNAETAKSSWGRAGNATQPVRGLPYPLGSGHALIRVRQRITADGGRSMLEL
ncbi:unnamed protein product [Penicillium olsonii]|uniref:AAA+ ATPase domain-containing protein n=1 Tax=Penicillium olsonii TaxID=99116 RepID=A0A9W4MW73_PENOL|nr:unnamed protein product [Penicillium olsonii]CAG8164463.1 unnamed protein product [Penicillium olsonii]